MQNSDNDAIQKTLNAIGVTYSHINDELLLPSRIEEERTKTTLRVGKNTSLNEVLLTQNRKREKLDSQTVPTHRSHQSLNGLQSGSTINRRLHQRNSECYCVVITLHNFVSLDLLHGMRRSSNWE